MAPQNIVILGGGVGGTLTANLLARKLTRKQATITVIDRTGRHIYQTGWLYVPFGGAPPEKLERSERRLLHRMVELVIGEVARIDARGHVIEMVGGEWIPYDHLVVATGAQLELEAIPGFVEGAHHFYSAEAALRLHAALREFRGGRIVVGAAGLPYKCPQAPLEFSFLLDDYLRKQGLRDLSEIIYVYPIDAIYPSESVAEFALPLLEERKIATTLNFKPVAVDPVLGKLTAEDGRNLDYDLLVMVPPHRGSAVVAASGLGDAQGWIATDRETLQSKQYDNVYALGDATDLPVNKSGAAAHFEAHVLANRLVATIRGEEATDLYNGQVMCFLEIGNEQATQMVFDYTHPPQPAKPSSYYHYEKTLLGRAYWHLVPAGMV